MSTDFPTILKEDTGPPSSDFRQILCDHMLVSSLGQGGVQLELFLDCDAAILRHSRQKTMLMPHLDWEEGQKTESLFRRLRHLPAGRDETFRLKAFAFRHASAGVLASLSRGEGKRRQLLLFWRDIHPIGWNVANGASSSDDEFLNVKSLALREAREELLFWNRDNNTVHALAGEGVPDELEEARHLWCAGLNAKPGDPVPWSLKGGPDTLVTHFQGNRQRTDGLALTLSAADFGIECIVGMEITVGPGLVPLDGELLDSRLLNRPVGLFATLDDARRGCAGVTYRSGRPLEETTALAALCPVTRGLLENNVFSFSHI